MNDLRKALSLILSDYKRGHLESYEVILQLEAALSMAPKSIPLSNGPEKDEYDDNPPNYP